MPGLVSVPPALVYAKNFRKLVSETQKEGGSRRGPERKIPGKNGRKKVREAASTKVVAGARFEPAIPRSRDYEPCSTFNFCTALLALEEILQLARLAQTHVTAYPLENLGTGG